MTKQKEKVIAALARAFHVAGAAAIDAAIAYHTNPCRRTALAANAAVRAERAAEKAYAAALADD